MEDKLVSVIITTHNRPPKVVIRALNSVLNQTYQNLEIIVVDDSSDDYVERKKVESAIRSACANIRYIKMPTSMGGCVARNTGLSQATGYYVAFLDDDDEWYPRKIEEQLVGFVDETIALVYSGEMIMDEVDNKSFSFPAVFRKGSVYNDLLKNNFVGGTSNPLLRREYVMEVGAFDIGMQSLQDYDLWLRIAGKYPINFVPKTLMNYYVHEGERISTNWEKQIKGCSRIISKYETDIKNSRSLFFLKQRVLVYCYVKNKQRKQAFQMWVKCVVLSPFSIWKNSRQLFLVLFGFDSILERVYIWMNDSFGKTMINIYSK